LRIFRRSCSGTRLTIVQPPRWTDFTFVGSP
jgi:hypothetical protein